MKRTTSHEMNKCASKRVTNSETITICGQPDVASL